MIDNTLYDLSKFPSFQMPEVDSIGTPIFPVLELLRVIFNPLIEKSFKPETVVHRAKKEVFMRRFGITSCDILDYVDSIISSGVRCILAGGKMIDWVNNVSFKDSISDYDLWPLDEKDLTDLVGGPRKFGWKHLTTKAHVYDFLDPKYEKKIQVVCRMGSCVEDVLEPFDIRACAIAYDGEHVYWIRGAVKDARQKRIRIQSLCPRRTTFVRIEKYLKRGYTIDTSDLALSAIAFLGAVRNTEINRKFYTSPNFSYIDALEHASEYPPETE